MEFIRPKKVSLSLDMAPLIDIVFQLLIFFMLSSSFLTPSLKLDLPQARQKDDQVPEEIVVSIEKNGTIFLNTRQITKSTLKGELETELRRDPKRAVHLRGDKEMPYQFFVETMDTARLAGARQILIVHEGKE